MVEPLNATNWGDILLRTSLAIPLTVNVVVMGSIVLRIIKVYLEIRSTSED